MPLLFYDWRGEDSEKRKVHAPAAVKNVVEIRNWFQCYILGADFEDEQEVALGIVPTHPLHRAFHDEKMSHGESNKLRELINEDLLPALAHLMEKFTPYRQYISELRVLEQEYQDAAQSDLARHAFYELRFGTNHADLTIKQDVAATLEQIKTRIDQSQTRCLKKPIDLDIGMRGVMAAFGSLRNWCGHPSWMEYSEWFTQALNRLYEDGWLDLEKRRTTRDLLRHIAIDHNETVVNYRLEDVGGSFGAYVALLLAAYGRPWPQSWTNDWQVLREELLEALRSTIVRGYKKEVRPQLREEYPNGGKELTEAVRRKAERLASGQILKLERELEKIEDRP